MPSVYVPTTVRSPVSCRGRYVELWCRCCALPVIAATSRVLVFYAACINTVLVAVVVRVRTCPDLPHIFLFAVKPSGCAHDTVISSHSTSTASSSRAANGQHDKGRTLGRKQRHICTLSRPAIYPPQASSTVPDQGLSYMRNQSRRRRHSRFYSMNVTDGDFLKKYRDGRSLKPQLLLLCTW